MNDREFQIFLMASKAAIEHVTHPENDDPFLERDLNKIFYRDEKYNYACSYFFQRIKDMYEYLTGDEINE